LFFLDGHADFYLPEQSLTGGVAGMDLAFATGRGNDILSDIDGEKPLVRDADTVVFGFRDMREDEVLKVPKLSETEIKTFNLPEVRQMGIEKAACNALQILQNKLLDGFWIHVDADVLDDLVMPAVDSRQPDGLSREEFIQIMKILLNSDKATGMHIGIFDPDMDKNGGIASDFTAALVKCFI
jgi:arginase